ncbi:MAG: hypothetical protein OEQ28_07875, partial [Acidobacteriota bacterium]|nr:hypothetical protein [Acidobacteriota bacterium]
DQSLPQKLDIIVKNELEIGERVDWSGMPVPAFFTPQSISSVLFGIPWTAFALFWTASAGIGTISIKGGLSLFSLFPLFGVPFILIGIGMLSAPLFAYSKARKTAYVITDRRAISFEGGRSTVIRSYSPEMLHGIYRTEKPDGSGDVIIKKDAWRDSDGDKHSEEFGFLSVRNVKEVEQKLRDLAKKAVRPRRVHHREIENDTGRIYPELMN